MCGLPVEVSLYEGNPWLDADNTQRPHRVFKRHVRVNCSEAAEVMHPNQQGSSIAHSSHIQLPDENARTKKRFTLIGNQETK